MVVNQGPTSFSDLVRIALRSDETILLAFISVVPEVHIENHRTVLTKKATTSMVDNLCKMLNYYPEKPVEIEKKAAKELPKKTAKKPVKKVTKKK